MPQKGHLRETPVSFQMVRLKGKMPSWSSYLKFLEFEGFQHLVQV